LAEITEAELVEELASDLAHREVPCETEPGSPGTVGERSALLHALLDSPAKGRPSASPTAKASILGHD
jgi:hypothetical protein